MQKPTRIQVLSIKQISGLGKKSGQPYSMHICQCVVHGDSILVGELVLPKDHPAVEPGMFDADFGVAVGQDKRITGQLVQLTPVSAVAVAAAPTAVVVPSHNEGKALKAA